MNKSELIDSIAASADLPKAAAGRALDAALEAITGALAKGDSVALVGLVLLVLKSVLLVLVVTHRLVSQSKSLQQLFHLSSQVRL